MYIMFSRIFDEIDSKDYKHDDDETYFELKQ